MNRILKTLPGALLLAALPAVAADWAGDWQIQGSIGAMPVSVICTLVEKDHALSGSCHNEQYPDLPITGESDADHAKWTYQVDFQGQRFEVTYSGQRRSPTSMDGSIAVGGNPSGSFSATRPQT